MATKRAFMATLKLERLDDVIYWTKSAGKARYQCFRDLNDLGYTVRFQDISIRRFSVVDDHEKKDIGYGVAMGDLYDVQPIVMEMMKESVFNGVLA